MVLFIALSVAESCLAFAPGLLRWFCILGQIILKVPSSPFHPVVLQAFSPHLFDTPEQERLNTFCPVRALKTYIHSSGQWLKTDQLFVCFGDRGSSASKQTIYHWDSNAVYLWPMRRMVLLRLWVWKGPRWRWQGVHLCKMFVLRQAGPFHTHSSSFMLWMFGQLWALKCCWVVPFLYLQLVLVQLSHLWCRHPLSMVAWALTFPLYL